MAFEYNLSSTSLEIALLFLHSSVISAISIGHTPTDMNT